MAKKKIEQPSEVLEKLAAKATGTEAIFFDFRKYCQKSLSVQRSDIYTHYLHPYPGKLLSYIPAFFLSDENIIPKDGIVLDPFCGSGTVLLESIVNPYVKRSAYGVEINPLGRLISRVKTTPLSISKLNDLKRIVAEGSSEANVPVDIAFKNIEMWFTVAARTKLQRLANKIHAIEAGPYRDFFLVCFSKTIRKCSLADPNIPPPVVLKISKYKGCAESYIKVLAHSKQSQDPAVADIFLKITEDNIARLRSLNDAIHNVSVRARIIGKDARGIKFGNYKNTGGVTENAKKLPDSSVSVIITSPPYLTAQKYVRSTRLELLWLGLATDSSLPTISQSTIGNEAAPRAAHITEDSTTLWEKYEAEVPELASKFKEIRKTSPARAKDVALYFYNMKKVFSEMYRVLKTEALAIVVIGDSKVLGRSFFTHRYLLRIAESIGFKLKVTLRDPIRSRKMLSGRHITGGYIEDEYVLVLVK